MQVTIDTRHDTLDEALAVIRLAFAQGKDSGRTHGSPESSRQARRSKAVRARGGRGSSPGAAVKGADEKAPAKKASPTTTAAKTAPASRSATKKAGSATSRASGTAAASKAAPPAHADLVRAWARDHGMQVKAAGRLPTAVISAYQDAHH